MIPQKEIWYRSLLKEKLVEKEGKLNGKIDPDEPSGQGPPLDQP